MKTVYGPVPSWRFGRSLGVDPICSREKICPFDCVYCQLGRTKLMSSEIREYVKLERIRDDLKKCDKGKIDVITFSGTGEPTLNSRLGEMIMDAKQYGFPVVVLTNSSLLGKKEVRKALSCADVVSAKLDAPDERLFQEINAPARGIHFDSVIEGLKKFREEFSGKLALQMMFIEANKKAAPEMAELARSLKPDEVQIDTPLRRSAVRPLSQQEIENIEKSFEGLPTISVYREKKPSTIPFDIHETEMRRPGGSL